VTDKGNRLLGMDASVEVLKQRVEQYNFNISLKMAIGKELAGMSQAQQETVVSSNQKPTRRAQSQGYGY